MSMAMAADARERFLAETRIGIFTVARPDRERAPLSVPVWYGYTPGGDVEVFMDAGSVKDKLLRQAGRFSLSVHTEDLPYRYVTVEGPATWEESPTPDQLRAVAGRYLNPGDTQNYVDTQMSRRTILVRMRPERWLSNDQSEVWAQLQASWYGNGA
ncbi:pyridoxamine 5'-phosphate oxidase family protein [Phytoactinopolyspora halotolerans]|uniref:Pyridoxamine 5'-phosphate oxidase n=1 Tax=Phytoactinopolyspora halotolerans TaxID=1981512 RepID=A0A6L9S4X4_9ACTN|nr:pyridoxamine 5'-phosphate oxidase family protein [Phytoactinopolyspora halotolerans]NED99551.1 pyridoxamine 5'-phosphate oxidase [Phytoactinopolyspora halotolerans]